MTILHVWKTYNGFDVRDVTLSVYPHRTSLKICPATVGIEPTTFGILAQCYGHASPSKARVSAC